MRRRSAASCTPVRANSSSRCRRCSRSRAVWARWVIARGESVGTRPYVALPAMAEHSCMIVSHVTHVNVPCRRARSSLSNRLASPDASTKNVTAWRPPFVCRISRRGPVGPYWRAASTSIGTAISPCLAQQSVRNAHQYGTRMSPPSHHCANCAAVSSPLRVALRAAASVHCGKPPTAPVLRALPARFAQVPTGTGGLGGASAGSGAADGAVGGVTAGGGATAKTFGAVGRTCEGACGAAKGAGVKAGAEATYRDPPFARPPPLARLG